MSRAEEQKFFGLNRKNNLMGTSRNYAYSMSGIKDLEHTDINLNPFDINMNF